MFHKTMILLPAALLGSVPLAVSAESMNASELEMFRSASVSIQQAGDAATKAHPGTLASVSFDDDNGRAAYEAVVIGADGAPWTVMIDAKSGEVFASAQSSDMEDHEDAGQNQSDDDQDGEADDN